MKEFETNQAVQELRRKFHEMDRRSREEAILEIVKGIHSLSGAYLAASKNDSFAAVMSANMDMVIDSPVTEDLLQLLVDLNNAACLMKGDIDDMRMVDMTVPSLLENIQGSYRYVRSAFNKIVLRKYKTELQSVVVPFKKKG